MLGEYLYILYEKLLHEDFQILIFKYLPLDILCLWLKVSLHVTVSCISNIICPSGSCSENKSVKLQKIQRMASGKMSIIG